MAEAKVNLGHIASLQGIYRAEWNAYASIGGVGNVGGSSSCTDNALGFVPDGCDDLRYGYSSDNTFSATAKNGDEIYPGCTVPDKDTWRVTKDNFKVKQIVNIVKHCQ